MYYDPNYDYQEPYFEPASREEDLIQQLNAKLAVTAIPNEQLEYVRCFILELEINFVVK